MLLADLGLDTCKYIQIQIVCNFMITEYKYKYFFMKVIEHK